jgi:transposase
MSVTNKTPKNLYKTMPNQYTQAREYHDETTLRELYHIRNMTAKEIGEKFDVRQETISYWLDKLNIETRSPKQSRNLRGTKAGRKVTDERLQNESWLREKYIEDELTLAEIADIIGVSSEVTILKWISTI